MNFMPPYEGTVGVGRLLAGAAPLTVGADVARGFLKGAVRQGVDPDRILRKAGLATRLDTASHARVDGRQFNLLLNTIMGEMNDLFMGFTAQPAKLALDREQARVRFLCSTLGEAMRVSTQFREAVRNDVTYQYIDDNERHEFTLGVNYQTVPEVDRELYHWHRLSVIYRYYCWLTGKKIVLRRVGFEGPPPATLDDARRYSLFGCEALFSQPFYSITFDKDELLRPIIRKSDAEHTDWLVNYPDWFSMPGDDSSWTCRTEQILMRLQVDGLWSPTISMVGAMLQMEVRSLRRHLAREGETFVGIRSRLRCELAVAYLTTTDLPITIVAEKVGFMEPGDFTRAFIGWTGLNPSTYRAANAGDKELLAACSARLHRHICFTRR